MRHLPNLISLIRLGLVWPVAAGLASGNYRLALVCFIAAGLSDGVDGFLAKRFGWTSELGKWLDPSADKLLLMTVFIECAWLNLTPWWLTIAAVGRDLMIGGGALLFQALIGPLHGRPTLISKANTGTQLLYLLSVMCHAIWDLPMGVWVDLLAVIALVTTLLSGADYLITFARRALDSPARHSS